MALAEENETSINGQLNDAIRLRNRRFAYRPRLQSLVDARIGRLTASFIQQDDTSLRDIPEILAKLEIRNTEAVASVMTRLGQGQFRADLFSYWGGCAVTGCKLRRILRASHIKPWRVSNDAERLDVHNGLLLVPHLDTLFDEGLISFSDDGRMLVSQLLDETNRKLFRVTVSKKISITVRHIPYLKYHRETVFVLGLANST